MNPIDAQPVTSTPDLRWYQCRLRTLLVTGIFVALVIGLTRAADWYKQWGARHLESLGAQVSFGKGFCSIALKSNRDARPLLNDGLSDLCHLSTSYGLRLSLSETNVSDTDLQQLAAIRGLYSLDLACTEITDKGLESLGKLKTLQELNLCSTRVTAEGAKNLQRTLRHCRILWKPPGTDEPQTVSAAD
jgi:hypothetical protein